MKRTRIRSRSAKKEKQIREQAPVRDFVKERDGRCRLAGVTGVPCMGRLEAHHLRKDIHGGEFVPENLLALCSTHNTWVETEPDVAHELGLVIRTGETWESAWDRLNENGLVSYGPTGEA